MTKELFLNTEYQPVQDSVFRKMKNWGEPCDHFNFLPTRKSQGTAKEEGHGCSLIEKVAQCVAQGIKAITAETGEPWDWSWV